MTDADDRKVIARISIDKLEEAARPTPPGTIQGIAIQLPYDTANGVATLPDDQRNTGDAKLSILRPTDPSSAYRAGNRVNITLSPQMRAEFAERGVREFDMLRVTHTAADIDRSNECITVDRVDQIAVVPPIDYDGPAQYPLADYPDRVVADKDRQWNPQRLWNALPHGYTNTGPAADPPDPSGISDGPGQLAKHLASHTGPANSRPGSANRSAAKTSSTPSPLPSRPRHAPPAHEPPGPTSMER